MSERPIRTVALIGTGIMGAPIGGHVLDAGYSLVVYNRSKKKAEGLLVRGARWAATVREAVQDADVVLTILGYPDDVENVYLTTDGVIRSTKRGAWMIDLTTSSAELARDIHDAAEVEDKHAFDCPVTGGQQGAQAGTLTLIAGATEEEIAPVRPLLETFSERIFCFGGPGKGQTAKLCNQIALASCMVGYAEALSLAEQGGIDRAEVVELLSNGMGDSAALEQLAPKSVVGDFRPGFKNRHMRKDLGLALRMADELQMDLPGTQNAFNLYDMLCETGGQDLGTQAVSVLYQDEDACTAAGLDMSLLDADQDEYDVADAAATQSGTHDHAGHDHCAHEHCSHDHADHDHAASDADSAVETSEQPGGRR